LLEDTESAEDDALQRYRATLDESLPTDVGAVVARLYEDVKRSHAQVRSLRDQARAASV
jgi:uncharacterized protein (TIGR02284 family)